ncbi:3beta-hydroxysteroid-dehydrogenase/decarboxylase-like protein [Gossypium arboreum]|uniref:Reticulon-like protein n=1 Tax=Gossypium arboreum TaxID=29729 RepID=A0A0B0MMJ5_GOSAR|nr:3beta-hydroxysteroid-dehydrogenase/decarboxylase-like protein [Gossypium arboreum]
MVVKTTANDVATEKRTCVVLGGRGFLGRSLVARLLQLGGWIVRVADSSSHSLLTDPSVSDSLLSNALCSGQASFCHVDVRDISQIIIVTKGADVVFYMEPTDLDIRDFYNCYMIIVQGAKNVINACRECKVRRLVYNSSADIVFDGSRDILDGDLSFICPGKFKDMLIDLKFQAEGLIRLANNIDGLLTCVLRPSNVFGPGDTRFVPLLVNLAKAGLAKFITGCGENMSDFTYTENVAHAHICAAETLDSRVVSVAGKAFFITNLEPIMFWGFVSLILGGLGYQRPYIKVPTWMVSCIVSLHQCRNDKLYNYSVSPHYMLQLASRTRTFDCSAAQNHLGYSPVVSMKDGIKLTIQSFSHLANVSFYTKYGNFNEQSKAEKMLGSGIVADILLWRDERRTFACFFTLVLVYCWFFLCGRTFASSLADLLLLVIVALYGHGILSSKICGFAVQEIPSSRFKVTESEAQQAMRSIAHTWNKGVRRITSLAKGEDWSKFFRVVISIYLFKSIQAYSVAVLFGIVLVFAFTAFFVYDQYEAEIDALRILIFCGIVELKGLLLRKLPASISSFSQHDNVLNQEKVPARVKEWKQPDHALFLHHEEMETQL